MADVELKFGDRWRPFRPRGYLPKRRAEALRFVREGFQPKWLTPPAGQVFICALCVIWSSWVAAPAAMQLPLRAFGCAHPRRAFYAVGVAAPAAMPLALRVFWVCAAALCIPR